MKYDLITIKTIMNADSKLGGLSFVESERDIPFAIERIYCIYKTEESQHRGFHAHKKNWQLLYCPYGVIDIILTDGVEKEIVTLDEPSKGLVLPPGLWREMIWKQDDSVLCVASSEYYDSEEYIRDYDEYLSYVQKECNDKNRLKKGGGANRVNDFVTGTKMLSFPVVGIKEGQLEAVEIESLRDVPFEIRRFFYIHGSGNVGMVRGKHANRNSEFVLFNISGKSKVKVIDENRNEIVYELNRPWEAVYLPRMVWKEMYDFTTDAVLMVLTNEYYDSEEYIREFDAFVDELKEKQ